MRPLSTPPLPPYPARVGQTDPAIGGGVPFLYPVPGPIGPGQLGKGVGGAPNYPPTVSCHGLLCNPRQLAGRCIDRRVLYPAAGAHGPPDN